MHATHLEGNIVDIFNRRIFYGRLSIEGNKITAIRELPAPSDFTAGFILPGFIDSHVHIESSLLVPSEFARLAVVHGTVATISDPHEIANVCGLEGVTYMIDNGNTVPLKFHFGAPSCVPATSFETSGATLNTDAVETLLQRDDIFYLSEMMNFPGVLNDDPEVFNKIAAAKKHGKPVDGHAPGVRGNDAKKYIGAGISTDHECVTAEEALDKLEKGMKILIREGSAAKNFDALVGLMEDHYQNMMFCSDDKHPDSLELGHINQLCERAVAKGIDIFKVLQAACINPVLHYKMRVGLLRLDDPADFVVVEDLRNFKVLKTFIEGKLVATEGLCHFNTSMAPLINHFNCSNKNSEDFSVNFLREEEIPLILALDGQLITHKIFAKPRVVNNQIVSDPMNDILKIVVVNRYRDSPVSKAFIKNFGLKQGAIASSVAHDSHNIVAVGVADEHLTRAVNAVIEGGGGLSVVYPSSEDGQHYKTALLKLPVAGLMSNEDGYAVAARYAELDQLVKRVLGSGLQAPFMTLSFMALLVIPHLKLSDKGLFDGDRFCFV